MILGVPYWLVSSALWLHTPWGIAVLALLWAAVATWAISLIWDIGQEAGVLLRRRAFGLTLCPDCGSPLLKADGIASACARCRAGRRSSNNRNAKPPQRKGKKPGEK